MRRPSFFLFKKIIIILQGDCLYAFLWPSLFVSPMMVLIIDLLFDCFFSHAMNIHKYGFCARFSPSVGHSQNKWPTMRQYELHKPPLILGMSPTPPYGFTHHKAQVKSFFENHNYIPGLGLWFLRTMITNPKNLPDNRQGVYSFVLVSNNHPRLW